MTELQTDIWASRTSETALGKLGNLLGLNWSVTERSYGKCWQAGLIDCLPVGTRWDGLPIVFRAAQGRTLAESPLAFAFPSDRGTATISDCAENFLTSYIMLRLHSLKSPADLLRCPEHEWAALEKCYNTDLAHLRRTVTELTFEEENKDALMAKVVGPARSAFHEYYANQYDDERPPLLEKMGTFASLALFAAMRFDDEHKARHVLAAMNISASHDTDGYLSSISFHGGFSRYAPPHSRDVAKMWTDPKNAAWAAENIPSGSPTWTAAEALEKTPFRYRGDGHLKAAEGFVEIGEHQAAINYRLSAVHFDTWGIKLEDARELFSEFNFPSLVEVFNAYETPPKDVQPALLDEVGVGLRQRFPKPIEEARFVKASETIRGLSSFPDWWVGFLRQYGTMAPFSYGGETWTFDPYEAADLQNETELGGIFRREGKVVIACAPTRGESLVILDGIDPPVLWRDNDESERRIAPRLSDFIRELTPLAQSKS